MNQNADQPVVNPKDRTTATILAFLTGTVGGHQFYLGNTGSAIARILMTITIIGMPIAGMFAIIEAVTFLKMTDEEFHRVYVEGNKSWL